MFGIMAISGDENDVRMLRDGRSAGECTLRRILPLIVICHLFFFCFSSVCTYSLVMKFNWNLNIVDVDTQVHNN